MNRNCWRVEMRNRSQ